jgi:hypothetical protein
MVREEKKKKVSVQIIAAGIMTTTTLICSTACATHLISSHPHSWVKVKVRQLHPSPLLSPITPIFSLPHHTFLILSPPCSQLGEGEGEGEPTPPNSSPTCPTYLVFFPCPPIEGEVKVRQLHLSSSHPTVSSQSKLAIYISSILLPSPL